MKKAISVVIPNYNGEHLLRKNIPTVIRALEFAEVPYEIIIPDDYSHDGSLNFLEKKYPEIKVIRGGKNLGFSGNINRGLRVATKELVFALNSDVQLAPDYFVEQFRHFEDPTVFGVMGMMKSPGGRQEVIVGAKVSRQTLAGKIDSTKNVMSDPAAALCTFYLSGANALMVTEKLRQLHFFDEIYSPFYKEDTDLGLRAWRMGWRCLFEPKAVAYHEPASTIQAHNKKKYIQFISRRNKFIFHYVHLGGVERVLYFGAVAFDFLTRWIILDFAYYRALFAFLKLLPRIRRPEFPHSTRDVLKKITRAQSVAKLVHF